MPIRHAKTVLNFKNQKTCMLEPFKLSKTHTDSRLASYSPSKSLKDLG